VNRGCLNDVEETENSRSVVMYENLQIANIHSKNQSSQLGRFRHFPNTHITQDCTVVDIVLSSSKYSQNLPCCTYVVCNTFEGPVSVAPKTANSTVIFLSDLYPG
jgi:hypothetical protein